MKSPKTKRALKALGIKQEQPTELRGLAAKGAGKETRFKPGDERLKKNQGARIQLVPPRAQAAQRKRMNELIVEYQHIPLAKELASAMGIEGEPTLVEAVVMGLFLQAIKGDINATKLIQAVTEPEKRGAGQFPAGPPPKLSIKIVREKDESVQMKLPAPSAIEIEAEEVPPFADTKENEQ